MVEQSLRLAENAHIIIATPSQLDHLLKCFSLKTIRYLVIDEADRII